jgi:hypothetical protein
MICIGFGTNDKLASRLIRWATRSEWSHVWIEYPSGVWGGRWVAHSWADGVVKVPLERVEAAYPRRLVYECRADLTEGLKWARQYIAAAYDYGVIWNGLLLALYRATGWGWLSKAVHRNAARYSCSEFVGGIFKASGVQGVESSGAIVGEVEDRFDPELTTPGDLAKFCADSDDFWVV